ncbi:radical SAM/SPASM domain-containing protein [Streptomyces cavernicola]|uniref:Radical SAM/SPASM domain-containing protein n=1 Tax=Streptomyces cavernicola TaxID=3043613 RepID=A0ABT6SC49_9ACTN|nr:radical SAM/SPASM domain-containing protein [Streptomyces sp. B-S-A6]MDI3405766.1 radical SAM/SPASM domain-containing protein [Streptomyces sp. B-S-A6]
MTAVLEPPTNTVLVVPPFLELEITGRCQLSCTHCYAESGPTKGHGNMTGDDWRRVLDEAAAIGVERVQFIGGEPTTHPEFTALVRHALAAGLTVQVYSNLYRVRPEHWDLYEDKRVSLATSYYSDLPADHDRVTGRKGSHAATRANIIEAVRRGIPLKVGVINTRAGQRAEQARTELDSLGVGQASIDHARGVGNAARTSALPSTSELCGRCAKGIAAVLPDGTVAPCVMGRFLPAGQVRTATLEDVFTSARWQEVAASIPQRGPTACAPDCKPADSDSCRPASGSPCNPMGYAPTSAGCSPDDSACQPGQPACLPKFP